MSAPAATPAPAEGGASAAAAAAPAAAVSANANPSGPAVLILGGCGFIGRHLVEHLSKNRLCSRIVVADKSMPAISNLNKIHKPYFDDKALVQFKHSDLAQDAHVTRLFKDQQFDYVFNLCGETRFGLSEADYELKNVQTSLKCAKAAAEIGVKKFIEVSTAQVYKPDKSASVESSSIKPWTIQAEKRHAAEKAVLSVPKLPVVILRPATVYGVGDLTGLTPRLACAATYRVSNEKMRCLWGEDLRINVVHVSDVVAAMWICANEAAVGAVYNLADQQDLTQGKFNKWLSTIFKIEVSYLGSLVSNLARLNLGGVAEEANDKHVPAFTELCSKNKILNTPITPYIDKELLKDNHLSVNGQLITTATTFRYTKQISEELVREQLDSFVEQGIFPPLQ